MQRSFWTIIFTFRFLPPYFLFFPLFSLHWLMIVTWTWSAFIILYCLIVLFHFLPPISLHLIEEKTTCQCIWSTLLSIAYSCFASSLFYHLYTLPSFKFTACGLKAFFTPSMLFPLFVHPCFHQMESRFLTHFRFHHFDWTSLIFRYIFN